MFSYIKNAALLTILLLVTAIGGTLMPRVAEAAPISVLTVDCTPLVSPGGTSFGPDNTIGMALQAADLGADFNVTEDTPAAFRARTAAQLAAFDLIAVNNHPARLGDGCVAGAGTGLGTTWQSVIGINNGGRVLLTSHDAARFHMIVAPGTGHFGAGMPGPGVEPYGADEFVRQAALWAGGGSNTGLLIFNDSPGFVGGAGWDNPELNLPAAWGISDLAQVGGLADGGHTDILAAFAGHPVYAGLSDGRFAVNSISSFAANIGDGSFDSIFGAFNPAVFTPTEVVVNAGVVNVGGLCPSACSLTAAPGPDGTAITLIRDDAKGVTISKDPRLANLWLCNAGPCDNKESGVEGVNLAVQLDNRIDTLDPKCVGFPNFLPPEECGTQQIGSFEFEVRFDEKYVTVEVEAGEIFTLGNCTNGIVTTGSAGEECVPPDADCVTATGEGYLRFACVTKGKPEFASQGPGDLAIVRVRPTADVYKLLIPNQENGIVTQLINQDCQLSDLQGHPIDVDFCENAAITIRYLEGDVHADCVIDVLDQQQVAFRWGAQLGNLLYDARYDLEPSFPQADGDIDAKDLQFVYGRHTIEPSTCKNPHPPQPPVDPQVKLGPEPTPTPTPTPTPIPAPLP